jgi:ferric-dicitrate binding protein FerR (iron transport regulator)
MPDSIERPWPELPPKSTGPIARLREALDDPRVRRRLRAGGLLVLALLAVLAVVLFVTRTYSFDSASYPGSVRRLTIEADSGEVSAIGSDRSDTLALWQLRYSVIRPRFERGVRDGTLRLRSHCPAASFRCTVIIGSQVPKATAVSIRTRSAQVAVQDLDGPVAITTKSGEVTVAHVAAPVHVDSGSGAVSLTGLQGDIAARTDSAPMELEDLHGRADLSSDSGAITGNAQALEVFRARTASGWVTATFDAPPQRIDVRSASGEVDVTVPAGGYRLDLEAPPGRIRLDGVSDDPAATRTIKIATGGGIHLSTG